MSLATPDRPIDSKSPGNFSLRRLRDRLRETGRSFIQSPKRSSETGSEISGAARTDADEQSTGAPSGAASPSITNKTSLVKAPPPPEVSRNWSKLPSPRLGDQQASSFDAASQPDEKDMRQILSLPLVVAVDVSGSTEGKILEQEKLAISLLKSNLEAPSLQWQSHILPWDGNCHRSLLPKDVYRLEAGWGTDPSVVLENEQARKALQDASVWFLMTDGYIEEPVINKFANNLSGAGIHGTASVIILFAYRDGSPYDCNVSVGMSVFAVAPDCVFLVHDVTTGELYVLQAKGSFVELLPESAKFTPFGPTTRWSDLTRITYDDLSMVKVPQPTRLSPDTVALPNGKHFDMKAIYEDTLSKEDTIELLADYSALDVILLAAKTRGMESATRAWLKSARRYHQVPDAAMAERGDIDSLAMTAMKSLLEEAALNLPSDPEPEDFWNLVSQAVEPTASTPDPTRLSLYTFRNHLRLAHDRNWAHFEARIQAELDLSGRLNETLDEVLSTMDITASRHFSPTPGTLTPMSSPLPGGLLPRRAPGEGPHYGMPVSPRAEDRRRMSPLSPRPDVGAYRQPYPGGYSHAPPPPPPTMPNRVLATDLLCLPGFKGQRTTRYDSSGSYATCPICRRPSSIQAIVLRVASDDEETPNLPKPGQRASHRYPLVLGNFPETDVILPITCCDSCASILSKAGELPNGDRVSAVLPLVPLQIPENRKLWEERLCAAYENRFHPSIVFLVFLSTLCTTLEDLTDGETQMTCYTLHACLWWCCREISRHPGISTVTGLTPTNSPAAATWQGVDPLQEAMAREFSGLRTDEGLQYLLDYPIDGYLVFIRLAALMPEIDSLDVEHFVWLRLLYYFTEQHVSTVKEKGMDQTREVLESLLQTKDESEDPRPTQSDSQDTTAPSLRLRVPLSALEGTYLLPDDSEILEQLQRCGSHFEAIKDHGSYDAGLAVFLHLLLAETRHCELSKIEVDKGKLFKLLQENPEDPVAAKRPVLKSYVVSTLV